MAVTVTHPFVSAIADGADATVVRPSNWNATHSISGTLDVANGGTGVTSSTGTGSTVLSALPTFAGAIVSVTDNTNAALRITQLGTGDALLVEDSTNPDATPVVINNSGNVGIGTSAPNTKLEVSSLTGSATPVPTEVRISTSSIASDWSTTLPWAQLGFYSADDSRAGPKLHASIAVISDITTGGTSSLDFNTSDNTGVLSQRMRIGSTGTVSLTSTTEQTGTTGAMTVAGGVYIAKKLAAIGGIYGGTF